MRYCEKKRKTNETDISLSLSLDKEEIKSEITTGVGFLDHMLELFARHSGFEINITSRGDTWVDDHHSTEDIGITLGLALKEALQDKKGIKRYGYICLPMDEALVMVSLDISGRGGFYPDFSFPTEKIGTFDTELVNEFFTAFSMNAGITLHIRLLSGKNSHHIAEAMFKGVGRALREAVLIDERFSEVIPSTKGSL